MNSNWQTFLTQQGAHFNEDGSVKQFDLPCPSLSELTSHNFKSSQAHQGIIKVSGADAKSFLQGQLTNDLNQCAALDNPPPLNTASAPLVQRAQYTSYCDPQGQVIAIITLFKWQEDYYLCVDASLKPALLKRLAMFVMRSKVILTDFSDTWVQLGLSGPNAQTLLEKHFACQLEKTNACLVNNPNSKQEVILIQHQANLFSVIGNNENISECWQQLSAFAPLAETDWQWCQIQQNRPRVTANTSGQFVAQFLNLDLLNAISFKKGCFPGQEVIARMHHRGAVVKRLVQLQFSGQVTLEAGQAFTLQDTTGKNYKFVCLQSATQPHHQATCALAITTLKSFENVQGTLTTESGIATQAQLAH